MILYSLFLSTSANRALPGHEIVLWLGAMSDPWITTTAKHLHRHT
jgi:hypothetical protein